MLLEQGTLLRVDPDHHRVTGRVELGAPTGGMHAGPLAVGAGAVWVGTREATVTARVDPVHLEVTARFTGQVAVVAHGLLWSYCCPRGDYATGFGRVDARTLRPARRWWSPTPRAGASRSGRLPSAATRSGPRRRRTSGCGGCRWRAAWPGWSPGWRASRTGSPPTTARCGCCRGTAEPGTLHDRTGRLRRLDQRTGEATATTPLPDLDVGGVNGGVGLVVGNGGVWLAAPYSRGLDNGGILLRVDPASGRVVGWLRDPRWFFNDVLAAGPRGLWVGTAAPELLHMVAA